MNEQKLLEELGFDVRLQAFHERAEQTVVVGMSGGVDSSVTALLVKLLGYRTIGVFMKNWDEQEDAHCSAEADWSDVKKVAHALSIPVYSVNFGEQYKKEVFQSFLEGYRQGYTPNPDVLCNREIKFKVFYDYAQVLGANYLATGHYCRALNGQLMKGLDPAKDQSYFLHAVNGRVLEHVLFPIGHLPKKHVREIAARFRLVTHEKKDSTGICFIGERDFKQFLSQYIETSRGAFIDLTGRKLGDHDGVCFYTIGQRKGLGIGGPGEPWFVVRKNSQTNEVTLAQGENHPALFSDGLVAIEPTWVSGEAPRLPLRCRAKVRYRQVDQDCVVEDKGGELLVRFDKPQRAITPHQFVVFYDGDICLGGARITGPLPSYFDLDKPVPVSGLDLLGSNP